MLCVAVGAWLVVWYLALSVTSENILVVIPQTCVYIYLARGAPDTQNELTRDALSTEGIRSWDEIVAGTLRFKDAHLAKLVFLSRDNFNGIAKGNVAYQVMADKAARVIEAGGDWEQF